MTLLYILTFFYVCGKVVNIENGLYEENGMEKIYQDTAKMLKAIAEPKRLRIIDMLSCGELCACEILEAFHITQPTLSHDMKVLVDAGLVIDRREGKNTYYSLNQGTAENLLDTLHQVFTVKPDCICRRTAAGGCGEDCCENSVSTGESEVPACKNDIDDCECG